ncbi:MAG: YeeE/YedE family protein [Rubrobacteraceae bacterium]
MQQVERSSQASGLADALPSPRVGVALGAVSVMAVLGFAIVSGQGFRQGILYGLGVLFGVALYHARFGFTSAFRQLISVGQGKGIRAHMLMLAAASVIFAPILAAGTGFLGVETVGNVSPLGVSVVLGAFIFGIGMQLGGACASGTLFSIGGGQTAILLTLAGFIGGSVIGAWHWGFWTRDSFNWATISLADEFGYTSALLIQLSFIGAVALVSLAVSRRRNPPPVTEKPSASGTARVVRGTWPLWVGALVLAGLNAATLFIGGSPWGVTGAFALWGSKIAMALGIDVTSWTYWSGDNSAALETSVLADVTSVMDFGIILGAMTAAAIGGTFALHKRIPWKTAAAAIIGGLLMGYGARLAYGCNIGAYFSGVASFSLHGWLWAGMALLGTYLGLKFRPLFGLGVPKPDDSRC